MTFLKLFCNFETLSWCLQLGEHGERLDSSSGQKALLQIRQGPPSGSGRKRSQCQWGSQPPDYPLELFPIPPCCLLCSCWKSTKVRGGVDKLCPPAISWVFTLLSTCLTWLIAGKRLALQLRHHRLSTCVHSIEVQVQASLPIPASRQCITWEAAGNSSRSWIPATHMENQPAPPGSRLAQSQLLQAFKERTSEWEIILFL